MIGVQVSAFSRNLFLAERISGGSPFRLAKLWVDRPKGFVPTMSTGSVRPIRKVPLTLAQLPHSSCSPSPCLHCVSLSLVTFCVAFCHGPEATTKPRCSSSVVSNECNFQLDRQHSETPRGGFSRTVDQSRSNTGSSLSWRSWTVVMAGGSRDWRSQD